MIVGLDIANSSIKIYDGEEALSYPNTLKHIDKYSVLSGATTFTYNQKMYLVGDLDYAGTTGRTFDRYQKEEYKVQILIALARLGIKDKIELIIGLPCEHYEDTELRNNLKELVKGKHTISKNDEVINLNVVSVDVIDQPRGTLIQTMYNEFGEVKNEKLSSQKKLVIDIGYGTTDVLLTNGMRIDKRFSINTGTMSVMNEVKSAILKQYGSQAAGMGSLLELDEKVRHTDLLKLPRHMLNVKTIKDNVYKLFIDDLIAKLISHDINIEEYDLIIFSGGGSNLLESQIHNYFAGDSRVNVLANGQFSNVKGYYRYGVMKYAS